MNKKLIEKVELMIEEAYSIPNDDYAQGIINVVLDYVLSEIDKNIVNVIKELKGKETK